MKTSLDTVDVNDRTVSSREYRRVIRYGVSLVLAALVVTPVAGIELGASYSLFAMLLAATIMGTAITALLLLVQARSMRSLPTAVLSAGFVYACATMVPYALLYPGMFPGFGAAIGAMNCVKSADQWPSSRVFGKLGSQMASGVRITYAPVKLTMTNCPHARAPGSARSASRSH